MRHTTLLIIIALILVVTVVLWTQVSSTQTEDIPAPSPTPSPTASAEPIETNSPTPTASPDSSDEQIILDEPQPVSTITSPLTISGQARGTWYFEATFPIVLTNWDGLIIAEGYATAEGDSMTEKFVPFTATLEFETPDYGERGFLILQKANPSGLPEHDDALEIEVRFETE